MPPFVFALVAQKGGAGKTTLSVNIAEAFRLHGKTAVLVDMDPQRSAENWRIDSVELGLTDRVPVICTSGHNLSSTLSTQSHADVIVIDTPGRDGIEAEAAARAASLVLIPVVPGPLDTRALDRVVRLLENAAGSRKDGGAPVLTVLNRAHENTRMARAQPAALREAGFDVAKTIIAHRIVHAEALAAGMGVVEYEPSGLAAEEIHALLAEVVG